MDSITNEHFALWLLLIFLSCLFVSVLAVPVGIFLSFYARRHFLYQLLLAVLLVPFAVGPDIWAFSMERLLFNIGLKGYVIHSNEYERAAAWFLLSQLRGVPFIVFIVMTMMQQRSAALRAYCRANAIDAFGYLRLAGNELPFLLVIVCAFFGAAATLDSAMPLYVYRSNPGTPPDSVSAVLIRDFEEAYGAASSKAAKDLIATGLALGAYFSLACLALSLAGAALLRKVIIRLATYRACKKAAKAIFVTVTITCILITIAAIGNIIHEAAYSFYKMSRIAVELKRYAPILLISTSVGFCVSILAVSYSILIRHQRALIRSRGIIFSPELAIAGYLLLVPTASLSYLVGDAAIVLPTHTWISLGITQSLFLVPSALLFSKILVSSIPEHRFQWFRSNNLSRGFIIFTEGIKANYTFILSMATICAVQVATDGVITDWFSSEIPAIATEIKSAVFGRTGSMDTAVNVSLAAFTLALTSSIVLSRSLCNRLPP